KEYWSSLVTRAVAVSQLQPGQAHPVASGCLVRKSVPTAIQFRAEPGTILTRRFEEAASLRLTRGSSWIWGIALNGVSANIEPLRLIQPCPRYGETIGSRNQRAFYMICDSLSSFIFTELT